MQKNLIPKFADQQCAARNTIFAVFAVIFLPSAVGAQQTQTQQQQSVPFTPLNFSNGKETIQIDADRLEMRDKENIAIFTGNVSVVQGQKMLRSGKLVVYYKKSEEGVLPTDGDTSIDHLEASDKVYIKSGTQIATGESSTYDSKTQMMVLIGQKVVLSDGDNVATGCKLTSHLDKDMAVLESCKGQQEGRVSVILTPKSTSSVNTVKKN